MPIKSKFVRLSILTLFIFMLSAIATVPVYADGETPPVEPPAVVEPVEPIEPPAQEESFPVVEEVPTTETVESILAEVPQDTEVIVLNEEGETIPLATEEAVAIITNGDPMWCPTGITPGGAGCTAAFNYFNGAGGLLAVISNKTVAGTIWIADSYTGNVGTTAGVDGEVNAVTLDGSLGTTANFALTIEGGWSGVLGSTTIIGTSEFNVPLIITNWNADITISNITIQGTTGANALQVFTTKNIILTNVQSNNNNGRGALLQNDSGTGNITVTNSQFNGNGITDGEGLHAESKGTITLKDVTASSNGGVNGYGVYLYNGFSATPKSITLTGTNTFNNNDKDGLFISSDGVITLNNIIATGNNGSGASLLNNTNAAVPNGITLTGTNLFNDNAAVGLNITTFGPIKISNIYANSNGSAGAQIVNDSSNTLQPVTFTGTNEFKYNGSAGLGVFSKGQITLSNISANSNGGPAGAYLITMNGTSASGVTITGTNFFNLNAVNGLEIQTKGAVLLNAITANGNSGIGTYIVNGNGASLKNVTITGFNSFSNNADDGLRIVSSGIITLNNITASFNNLGGTNGDGVNLDNTLSGVSVPKAVVLAGTNEFNANDGYGLYINTFGAVTTNNVTANENGQGASGYGVYIENSNATLPQTVTLNGTNKFNDNANYGLFVNSKGAIRTNAVTANGNGANGVFLQNNGGTATSKVTMTGVNVISNNMLTNLSISSSGAVLLNSITANSSVNDNGADIFNTAATSASVTLTGTNTFSSNSDNGLMISSDGAITISNLTASNNGPNGSFGAWLVNTTSPTKAGITLTGLNSFTSNSGAGVVGLQVDSLGNIKINSVTASFNGGKGIQIDNSFAGAIGSVTLSGTNIFQSNGDSNLQIISKGMVSLSNITSTGAQNSGNGASIDNTVLSPLLPKTVTISGTNVFSGNAGVGLAVLSTGAITLNNVTAESNGLQGTYLSNSTAPTPAGVTLTGTNKFNSNGGVQGLYLETKGLISIANITASGNTAGEGASLNNNISGATAGVTLSGINTFSSNFTNGLTVVSNGAITISNLTVISSQNGYGASLNNIGTPSNVATPKSVTLSSTNNISNNKATGLIIDTYGSVLINSLTANYNGSVAIPGSGADIDNYVFGATTTANVTLTGTNTFTGNYVKGLLVESFGTIKISNLTANSTSTSRGAELNNKNALSNASGVTLTGVNKFIGNGSDGLFIESKGTVTLNTVTATGNVDSGVSINNTFAGNLAVKPVTLIGTHDFSNNFNGLLITTYGLVTASNVTASNNTGAVGVSVYSNGVAPATPAGVNFTGTNVFNNNAAGNGLLIIAKGKITLNNITTNNNGFSGLDILNNGVALTSGVTVTGYGFFNNNGDNGATIVSTGPVNLTKITGDQNGQSGLVVQTSGAFTLTCGSFNLNTWYGWEANNTVTLATLKGVFTAGNGLGDFNNLALSTVTVRNCPLP